MQRTLPAVAKGKAVLAGNELRCAKPREDDPAKACNKLIAKTNKYRQIAGNFRCERCKEQIEVRLVPVRRPDFSQGPAYQGHKESGMTHQLRLGEAQQTESKEVSPS